MICLCILLGVWILKFSIYIYFWQCAKVSSTYFKACWKWWYHTTWPLTAPSWSQALCSSALRQTRSSRSCAVAAAISCHPSKAYRCTERRCLWCLAAAQMLRLRVPHAIALESCIKKTIAVTCTSYLHMNAVHKPKCSRHVWLGFENGFSVLAIGSFV